MAHLRPENSLFGFGACIGSKCSMDLRSHSERTLAPVGQCFKRVATPWASAGQKAHRTEAEQASLGKSLATALDSNGHGSTASVEVIIIEDFKALMRPPPERPARESDVAKPILTAKTNQERSTNAVRLPYSGVRACLARGTAGPRPVCASMRMLRLPIASAHSAVSVPGRKASISIAAMENASWRVSSFARAHCDVAAAHPPLPLRSDFLIQLRVLLVASSPSIVAHCAYRGPSLSRSAPRPIFSRHPSSPPSGHRFLSFHRTPVRHVQYSNRVAELKRIVLAANKSRTGAGNPTDLPKNIVIVRRPCSLDAFVLPRRFRFRPATLRRSRLIALGCTCSKRRSEHFWHATCGHSTRFFDVGST
ncbi:hypothetical protein DFH09DRAFT_1089513 [Mycena vulgaris]|nr:hypothetical protein DFH09DRAFT_1089513 [Mycena vulgaris]